MSLILRNSNVEIPKEKIYSNEENESFTRQLLSEDEKSEILKTGLLTIDEVREIISQNHVGDDYKNLDYEILVAIDSRIDYNIYIVDDNIYTYAEMYAIYPFKAFNIIPESVFNRKIIAFFKNEENNSEKIEVLNDGDVIISTYDIIKLSNKKKSHLLSYSIDKVIRSKIFIGDDKWRGFLNITEFYSGMISVSQLQIDNGQTPEFLKPFTAPINTYLALTNETPNEITTNTPNNTPNNSPNYSPNYSPNNESINEITNESMNEITNTTINNLGQRLLSLESTVEELKKQINILTNKL
jgi:hypothetical protein